MAQAQPNLPTAVSQYGLTMRKSTGLPMMIIGLSSPHNTYTALYQANYANINIIDALYRVPGVGEVRVFGAGDYAMRIWLRPDDLSRLGLTVPDVARAVQQQSTVNPSGQIGADPVPSGQEMTYTVRAQGRLETAEEFGHIVVRANPDGSLVRLSDVAPDGIAHPVATGRLRTSYPAIDNAKSLVDSTGAVVEPYGRFDFRDSARIGEARRYHVEFWPIGN